MHLKFRVALLSTIAIAAMAILCLAAAPRAITAASSDSPEEAQIRAVIDSQAEAWNRGDIDAFMTPYWKSEETEFVGASGITRGWEAVRQRFHRVYPDRGAMGTLTFTNLEIHVTCSDAAYVVGQFQLQRDNDKPAGIFSLDFKKFPEGWRIVLDHTTAFPSAALVPAATH